MIDHDQFRDLVVLPVCKAFPRPEEAATLLMRIAAHESLGGKYLRQIGDNGYGPGRGLWQMEPATLKLVCDWLRKVSQKQVDNVRVRLPLSGEAMDIWLDDRTPTESEPDRLMFDQPAACFFARVLLYASKWQMPDEDDHEKAFTIYLDVWRPGKPPDYATFIRRYEQWGKGQQIT